MATRTMIVPGDGDPRHGSVNGYTNLRCSATPDGPRKPCEACRKAWADEFKRKREERRLRLLKDPSLAEHGKPSTYTNWGCRCTLCTAAHTQMTTNYRRKRAERKKAE
jgi:cation diffusion facilitator CzcD-associated flavoprotein CzcO